MGGGSDGGSSGGRLLPVHTWFTSTRRMVEVMVVVVVVHCYQYVLASHAPEGWWKQWW